MVYTMFDQVKAGTIAMDMLGIRDYPACSSLLEVVQYHKHSSSGQLYNTGILFLLYDEILPIKRE